MSLPSMKNVVPNKEEEEQQQIDDAAAVEGRVGGSSSTSSNNNIDPSSYGKLPPVVQRIEDGKSNSNKPPPICVIVVGMAGSGKTTLMTQLQRSLDDRDEERYQQQQQQKKLEAASKNEQHADNGEQEDDDDDYEPSYYCVNLDPATLSTPYDVSIDIRDTVNYKQVMEQHQLGPNGAIMTSLNLFCTKFDQVMNILERRAYGSSADSNDNTADVEKDQTTSATTDDDDNKASNNAKRDDNDNKKNENGDDDDKKASPLTTTPSTSTCSSNHHHHTTAMEYILVDTPGQIEAFTWSASGQIISESLASAFPTVLCFVVDTVRCAASPNTFMSNMLYACSMLYRTRLPLVICFNKIDVVSHEFCLDWMRNHESFQNALDDTASTSGFYGSLTRSLSLVLDEFYSNFAHAVGVSAVTGDGIINSDFWNTIQQAAQQDFCIDYVQDLKHRMEERQAQDRAVARNTVQRLQHDLLQSQQQQQDAQQQQQQQDGEEEE